MTRDAPEPTGRAAADASAAAAEGRETIPTVEDDDIDGALVALAEARSTIAASEPRQATTQGARGPFADAIDRAIAAGARHDIATPPTVGEIIADTKSLLRQTGKAIRIPKRDEKLRAAVCAMLQQLDEGHKPSAQRAAVLAGVSGPAAAKLAYRVPIKSEAMSACTCLLRNEPFVRLLHTDAGWLRLVNGGHKSLAELGEVLACAHVSLSGRAAVTAGARAKGGNIRGAWHADALSLAATGWTANRIARRFGKSVKTVESVLHRKRGMKV